MFEPSHDQTRNHEAFDKLTQLSCRIALILCCSECNALQMESLKRDMLAKIAETKAACEANIEAKAIELAEELESADRCPCAPSHPAW